MCGCSNVTVDGVSDMLYERQEALEALENGEEKASEVSAFDGYSRRAIVAWFDGCVGKCSKPTCVAVASFHYLLTTHVPQPEAKVPPMVVLCRRVRRAYSCWRLFSCMDIGHVSILGTAGHVVVARPEPCLLAGRMDGLDSCSFASCP